MNRSFGVLLVGLVFATLLGSSPNAFAGDGSCFGSDADMTRHRSGHSTHVKKTRPDSKHVKRTIDRVWKPKTHRKRRTVTPLVPTPPPPQPPQDGR